jgi:hypothetical protein
MSNELAASIGMTMFGRRKAFSAPRLVRVLNSRTYFRRRLKITPLADAIAVVANRALAAYSRVGRSPPRGYTISKVMRFDSRFDALWARIRHDYPIMVWRSARHLTWRYGDPETGYETFALESCATGDLLGYAVTTAQRLGGLTRATIVDLVSPKEAKGFVPRLLIAGVLRYLQAQNVDIVVCWMLPHTHFYPHLRRFGFVQRRKGVMDLTFGLSANMEPLGISSAFFSDERNWFFTAGDTDWA